MNVIKENIDNFLKNEPSVAGLTDYINGMRPNIKPQKFFHELDVAKVDQMVAVYVNLMVQDISETYFYYSMIIKQPLNQKSGYNLFKFGHEEVNDCQDILDDPNYLKIMTDRQVYKCIFTRYQSEWVQKLTSNHNILKRIQMIVDGKINLKLGQVFHAVCLWNPKHDKLYYIRSVDALQVTNQKLDLINQHLNIAVDFVNIQNKLLEQLKIFCSQKYAYFLLFSMISSDKFFLSCNINLTDIISLLLPRVLNLQIKAPFKQSLFPYKNQDGQLIMTPMQTSNEYTFIIIDFSKFSQDNQVKIQIEQIDNLKALKLYVQQGKTIYRWQIGQSLLQHQNNGLIIKSSNIITPKYHLKDQKVQINPEHLNNFKQLSQEQKLKFRTYLNKAKKMNPKLTQNSRKQVELLLLKQECKQIRNNNDKLSRIMDISKHYAMSLGRNQILIDDFKFAKQILKQE